MKRGALPYLTCINENLWCLSIATWILYTFDDWLKDIHTIIAQDVINSCPSCRSSHFISRLLLANVNSSSRSLYVMGRPSVCRLSSETLVHPTQAIEIFGNVSMWYLGHP